jgi:hypothetical protein
MSLNSSLVSVLRVLVAETPAYDGAAMAYFVLNERSRCSQSAIRAISTSLLSSLNDGIIFGNQIIHEGMDITFLTNFHHFFIRWQVRVLNIC